MARKGSVFLPIAALLALALSGSSVGDDAALFEVTAINPPLPAHSIPAGHAPIDEALDRLAPPDYRVFIDKRIPGQTVLVWPSGNDWRAVLTTALAPLGLIAQQDGGVIRVLHATARKIETLPAPEPRNEAESEITFFADRRALPPKDKMRLVTETLLNGGVVLLKGHSATAKESLRIKWANLFAERMRARLLSAGIPKERVIVVERAEYKVRSAKPGVEFILKKGGLN